MAGGGLCFPLSAPSFPPPPYQYPSSLSKAKDDSARTACSFFFNMQQHRSPRSDLTEKNHTYFTERRGQFLRLGNQPGATQPGSRRWDLPGSSACMPSRPDGKRGLQPRLAHLRLMSPGSGWAAGGEAVRERTGPPGGCAPSYRCTCFPGGLQAEGLPGAAVGHPLHAPPNPTAASREPLGHRLRCSLRYLRKRPARSAAPPQTLLSGAH